MSKKRLYLLVGGGVTIAAIVLSLVFGAFRNINTEPEAAGLLASNAISSQPSGPPGEGIKVHGHWTIEVRNPDGTVAERREFDNALVSPVYLAAILAREESVGGWRVRLEALVEADNAFADSNSLPKPAELLEITSLAVGPNIFKNLTVANPQVDPYGQVVMSGAATANRDGKVEMVSTIAMRLPAASPPSSTYEGLGATYFTSTQLANALILTSGQQVNVTVVLSFS
ncbi:MAG: hypothetical protein HYX91_01425 [Chloroflexi bacterium]|nr:hypothetical protein [Chloroflexota bacterium]